eukprot:CAMPEP_0174955976 /NCGR_PEP_ID=MMETSP0004_2-20121128/1277_1 /TAXON_ID=420556 /ORGANISM="Ochromonas sp., Strain CCMP1393" /LENGTH=323 /DNA_ID=CAMNT_0016203957 /DNA_START=33 /DNA_END=1001 /DNA_ORIENTATION=-
MSFNPMNTPASFEMKQHHVGNAVVMRTTIYDIYDVNPVKQTFCAEIGLHMTWYSEKIKEITHHVIQELKQDYYEEEPDKLPEKYKDKIIVPNIYLENCLEQIDVNNGIVNIRKADPVGTVRWEKRIQGEFKEIFELQKFPYDVQTLMIRVRLNSHLDNKILKRYFTVGEGEEGLSVIKPTVFVPEWRLYKPFHKCTQDEKGKPIYDVYMTTFRRHGYFTRNIIVMMGSMCTLCLGAFGIHREHFADRCSVVLTLLLTAIAFKFVVADSLPKIPYLTVLDVQQTITAFMENRSGDVADRVFFYISLSGWVLVNLYFTTTILTYL